MERRREVSTRKFEGQGQSVVLGSGENKLLSVALLDLNIFFGGRTLFFLLPNSQEVFFGFLCYLKISTSAKKRINCKKLENYFFFAYLDLDVRGQGVLEKIFRKHLESPANVTLRFSFFGSRLVELLPIKNDEGENLAVFSLAHKFFSSDLKLGIS
jgi:hypothetical protein